MRPIARWLLIAFGLLLSAAAQAQPFGYASGTEPETFREALYRVDLATGAASRIGYIGFRDIDGLAIHPDGTLYGAADGSSESGGASDLLVRINPQTGAGTYVAHFQGLAGMGPGTGGQLDYGLAATCDGQLWMSSDTLGHLWRVNRTNGAVERVLSSGPPLSGLAARGQMLYGISVEAEPALYRFDTATQQMNRVGALGLGERIYDAGLDFDADGRLWVTLDYMVPPEGLPRLFRNDLAELDAETGAILSIRPITGTGSGLNTVQLEGFALAAPACPGGGVPPPAPVAPEVVPADHPVALLLLVLAMLSAATWGLRRRS